MENWCGDARQLALAYKIERMIGAGELRDYADAARPLGMSRARVSQVTNLPLLPQSLQVQILLGTSIISERSVRRHPAPTCVDRRTSTSAPAQASRLSH